jgi:murein DD-endopeptidase MepM/ murein hydrolase activator NlpD
MRIIRQNRGKSDLGEADVKGVATSSTRSNGLKSASKPNGGKAPQFAKAMTPVMPGIDASGKTSTLVAGWSRRGTLESSSASKNGGDSFGVAALQAAPHDRASSPTGRNKLDLAQPIVPAGDAIGRGLEQVALQENLPAIEIPARPRQRVAAPDNGRVVFAGDFRSYGLLLIIEHDSEYHTLLWGFSSLGVGLGDQVRAGQIVGLVGTGQSPKLHVELRRNGQPVSPEVWLAASNSGVKG